MVDFEAARRVREAREYIQSLIDARGSFRSACPGAEKLNPLPSEPERVPHAAVDGGSQIIDFTDVSFYYVKAWAHLYEAGISEGDAWLGLIVPPHHPDYRVSIYREILEASVIAGIHRPVAESIASRAGLVLFDGSLRNAIRWWSPGAMSYGSEELARMDRDLPGAERVLWELYNSGVSLDSISFLTCSSMQECAEELVAKAPARPITARLILEMGAKGVLEGHLKDGGKWITALEVLEKLYAYKKALEEAWRNDGIALFLSKHSVSTALCRGKHSDIYYIKRIHPLEPGYIVWDGSQGRGEGESRTTSSLLIGAYAITRLRPKGKRGGLVFYPRRLGLYDFYTERLASIEFYVRLSRGGPFMLANIAFDSSMITATWDNARALLEKALRRLVGVPLAQGYPLALTIAHYHARILPDDALALARGVGLEVEVPAREMLKR